MITIFKIIIFPFIILIIIKYSGMINLVSGGKMILLISLPATITPSASVVTQMVQLNG
ncbi:hypothetical protein LL033_25895 (plasmid) [Clostridium estertheticum]|uniref:hypothetical protein n=1 Tax=Clostridium estertheticum TaxID=238834 RepID=UPI001C0DD027|nr:hypothetical protein [Clostridium estertheticum]MBU3217414.1 hypothetical protein [Clostridium estertheticum]WAG58189.1 hypothetical protein LL033_25895 [Clostridium estertheticum]